MNTVFIIVLLNEDDTIVEIISAHPSRATAVGAERFYWAYEGKKKHKNLRSEIVEVNFEAG